MVLEEKVKNLKTLESKKRTFSSFGANLGDCSVRRLRLDVKEYDLRHRWPDHRFGTISGGD